MAETPSSTYPDLLAAIQKARDAGEPASSEQAAQVREAIDRLLNTTDGPQEDFNSAARSGFTGGI